MHKKSTVWYLTGLILLQQMYKGAFSWSDTIFPNLNIYDFLKTCIYGMTMVCLKVNCSLLTVKMLLNSTGYICLLVSFKTGIVST